MLIIGSEALIRYTCGGDPRIPKDLDFIATHDEARKYISDHTKIHTVRPSTNGRKLICLSYDKPVEIEIAWPGSTAEEILASCPKAVIASLNLLYLLKMSHRYLKHSPHFEKTMRDIQLMRVLGAEITNEGLLKRREKETYDYPHPNLNQGKDGFFDPNQLKYVWDHDSIHLAMAVDPLKPAYTKYKLDGAEVRVDRRKWEALPYEVKLQSVYEEACVLALERSQVPYRDRVTPDRSFTIALQRLCSSISSGWWREWAWEHYDEVMQLYKNRGSYVEQFDRMVEAGIVVKDTRSGDAR